MARSRRWGVFALHPLQSESVAFVVARNDPMAAALGLGALWVVLPRDAGGWRLVVGGGLFLLALLAKESAVVLPGMLLALDAARFRRVVGWRRCAALGLGLVLVLLLRQAADVPDGRLPSAPSLALLARESPDLLGLLGGLLVLPHPLSTGRHLLYLDVPLASMLGGLAALALGGALLVRRGGGLAVAGLVAGALLLLPSAFAVAGTLYVMERYVYLPMAGVALAVAAAWPEGRRALTWGGLVALTWVAIIEVRLPDWRSDEALFESAAERTPGVCSNSWLGIWMLAEDRPDEALPWLLASLVPQGVPRFPGSCAAAAEAAVRAGDLEQALALARADNGCRDDGVRGAWEAVALARAGAWDELNERIQDPGRPLPELWMVAAGARAAALGDESGLARIRAGAQAVGIPAERFDVGTSALLGSGREDGAE